jgi:hypothetical protein
MGNCVDVAPPSLPANDTSKQQLVVLMPCRSHEELLCVCVYV